LKSLLLGKKQNHKPHSLHSLLRQLSPLPSCLNLPGEQWKVCPALFGIPVLPVVRLRQPKWTRRKHWVHVLLLSEPEEEMTLATRTSLILAG